MRWAVMARKIYRSPAGAPGPPASPFAGKTDAGTFFHAGRNGDLEVLFLALAAGAATGGGTGRLITWPAPWHMGQVRSTVKKPCWLRTLPHRRQVGQLLGAAPFFGAGAFARLARDRRRYGDLGLLCRGRLPRA